ncbi:MAG TPA: hypothetical protein VLA37_10105 [Sphingomonadaceae bacterium]|nr:hypothetical protein [Sphingomonadaceae bacterium]
MSDGAAKSISGGKLLAICLSVGVVFIIVMLIWFQNQLEALTVQREAELQAEYAAYEAAAAAEEEAAAVEEAAEAPVEDGAVAEEAPAE